MSTYSTNLALTLIGTGEEAGTWGTTTNTNLGTLLEQAISGYVTQAVTDSGTATTLTIPNGSSGVARNMYIELTGTLTAARTVEVPANRKLYFVYNNTTGGFAVTFKVTGQTGISIPNGKRYALVSNGSDIVAAINGVVGMSTVASAVQTTNYTMEESGGKLVFKYGATTIASFNSAGLLTTLSDLVSNGTP
jgi:hypothetical protein